MKNFLQNVYMMRTRFSYPSYRKKGAERSGGSAEQKRRRRRGFTLAERMEARVAGSARRVVVGAAAGPARPHRRAGAPRAGHGPERLARNKVAGGMRGVASLRPARAKDSKDGADSVDENMVDMSGQTGSGQEASSKRVEWLQSFLQRFKPVQDKNDNVTALPFEKPLFELDKRIIEVKKVAEENGVDVSSQVRELEQRASQLRHETYSRLTPMQRLQVARHPNRPTFLDVVLNITDKWVELHGDRAGYDDPSLVCGIGSIDGNTFMFIGQQKGRNTKENIHRNFGMPTPNGYRKALRFMRHADKFGIPIITFVDTPGAYAGKKAEELGQGEAIALNLREMFGFRVPILSVVIGEGGSGGALAIGCANKMLIMEHAVYYVASPEACAAILWKSRDKADQATEALRITSKDLTDLGIMDEVIPEPLGAAHSDPVGSFMMLKQALMNSWDDFKDLSEEEVRLQRYAKFRKLGRYIENPEDGPVEYSTPIVNEAWTEKPEQPEGLEAGYRELLLAAERVVQLEREGKDPSAMAHLEKLLNET